MPSEGTNTTSLASAFAGRHEPRALPFDPAKLPGQAVLEALRMALRLGAR